MSDLLHRFLFPDVDRHLLTDDGEYVIDEVEKHWIVTVVPVLALVASVLCFPVSYTHLTLPTKA